MDQCSLYWCIGNNEWLKYYEIKTPINWENFVPHTSASFFVSNPCKKGAQKYKPIPYNQRTCQIFSSHKAIILKDLSSVLAAKLGVEENKQVSIILWNVKFNILMLKR